MQVDKLKQPTSDLIPLVLMVREEIPAYKAIVQGVVAQAAASRGLGAADVAIHKPHATEMAQCATADQKRRARPTQSRHT